MGINEMRFNEMGINELTQPPQVDSVAALVPRAEIEGELSDAEMALRARIMSKALRVITPLLSPANTSIIFINQIRSKVGVFVWWCVRIDVVVHMCVQVVCAHQSPLCIITHIHMHASPCMPYTLHHAHHTHHVHTGGCVCRQPRHHPRGQCTQVSCKSTLADKVPSI